MFHGIMTWIASCLASGRGPVASSRHFEIWLMPWWLRWLRRYKLCLRGSTDALLFGDRIGEVRSKAQFLLARIENDMVQEMNGWIGVSHDMDYYDGADLKQFSSSDDGLMATTVARENGMIEVNVHVPVLRIATGSTHPVTRDYSGRDVYNCLLLSADSVLRELHAMRRSVKEACATAEESQGE